MAFTVIVTPGKQFAETEAITIPKLNLLGTPTVTVSGTLGQASDVDYSTPPNTTGQALVWDNASGKWEPSTAAQQVGRAYLQTMTGANSGADGAAGAVPQPLIAQRNSYLQGNGTWSVPAGTSGADLYLNETQF